MKEDMSFTWHCSQISDLKKRLEGGVFSGTFTGT